MTQVFVLARDQAVSDSLREVCDEAGLIATCWLDAQLATVGLSAADAPIVVFMYHGGADSDCEDTLSVAAALPAHVYVVISTHPQTAPRYWNGYTRRFVPILPAPFDLDDLLDVLTDAVARASLLAENPPVGRQDVG